MVRKHGIAIAVMILLLAAPFAGAQEETGEATKVPAKAPKVEVVFALDTTGSMGGLIEGAKLKIWKIVNQIVTAKPVPDLRVGLVAYRDRGDAYVTQFTPLSNDLDAIYQVLLGFEANGGGDTPESVNQALSEALTKPDWSEDDHTVRIIYLVGDCPPHMDYEQDVKYPETCEAAARKGIFINTVQCGNHAQTTPIWQDIARRAEGQFVQISQSGGMTAVATPYDEELAKLSGKLSGTALFYGDRREREAAEKKLEDADDAAGSAAPEADAERAGFRAKSGRVAERDLLGMLERGEVKLEDVKDEYLPESIAKLEGDARKAKIEALLAERKQIKAKLLELDKKRMEYLKKELAKAGDADPFDEKVLDMIKKQSKKVGLTWDD